MIQILPHRVGAGDTFFSIFATRAGVSYYEWTSSNPNASVFHAHMLPPATTSRYGDVLEYVARAPPLVTPATSKHYYTFWINQDILIDWEEFRVVLIKAICKSKFNSVPVCR